MPGHQLVLTMPARLQRVSPERFIVLEVTSDTDVRGFVLALGLPFQRGRIFFEIKKREWVHGHKDVVLLDARGELHSGASARARLGLPNGEGAYLKPSAVPEGYAAAFVQSKSHNRVLRAGSRVLYEQENRTL